MTDDFNDLFALLATCHFDGGTGTHGMVVASSVFKRRLLCAECAKLVDLTKPNRFTVLKAAGAPS